MRLFNFLLALMFLAFAFVQVNDPDPILWILIYGAMAVNAVMAMFKVYIPKLLAVLALGFAVYGAFLFPGVRDWYNSPDRSLLFDDLAKMQYYYIEEAREFLGLAICVAVCVFYLLLSRKGQPYKFNQ